MVWTCEVEKFDALRGGVKGMQWWSSGEVKAVRGSIGRGS